MKLAESIESGQVSRSAADVYDEFFVPALFGRWAGPVAAASAARPADTALDVACGTGVLARALAERVGPGGSVTGVDINDGMLGVARRRAPDIEWRLGEAERLPFDDASFDAVASQFGLMFFRDRARAVSEMARVLKPGRQLAVAVWGRLEDTPGYAAAASLLARLFGEDVAESLRSPYCLGDKDALRKPFDAAGLEAVTIQTVNGVNEFDSIDAWMHTDVRGWTLADAIDDAQFERLLAEARETLAPFAGSDGRVSFAAPAHIVTARRAD